MLGALPILCAIMSRLMKMARRASERVKTWSPARQAYAARVKADRPHDDWCEPGRERGLEAAIEKCQRELPGWLWSVCVCHVSADATVTPDITGPDAHLLKLREFDEGIDGSLLQPATAADALLNAIELAKAAKARACHDRTTDFQEVKI
jgi:hypothetical protein